MFDRQAWSSTVAPGTWPVNLARKNALFAGHDDEGARIWGVVASLVVAEKLSSVEPYAYLAATLRKIVEGHRQKRIDELPVQLNRACFKSMSIGDVITQGRTITTVFMMTFETRNGHRSHAHVCRMHAAISERMTAKRARLQTIHCALFA